MNAFLANLKSQGAILAGKCVANKELNTAANITEGKVFFDFEFTPAYPAEQVTFRCYLNNENIEENQEEEVLRQLQAHPFWRNSLNNMDRNHCLTKRLKKKYPMEVCEMYWQECETLCSEGKKDNYRYVVSVLKEIRDISDKNKKLDDWKQNFAIFVEKHKRKRILMEYIDKEKSLLV